MVGCTGVFSKDTTHAKLAAKFDSRNIVYGEVDGPDGTKLPATIVFPNDPRRRLEVLWNSEPAHTDPSVVSINGRSQWAAPKGLKLGLSIVAIEKLNHRPFKLSGFGADGSATALGWEGGALSTLPGGCSVGIRVVVDSSAPEEARQGVAEAKELLSNDPKVRALKPTLVEILVGF